MGDGVASPTGAPGAREAARPRPRGTQIRGGEPPNARTLNAHLQCPLGERQPTRGRPPPRAAVARGGPAAPKGHTEPHVHERGGPGSALRLWGDGSAAGWESAGKGESREKGENAESDREGGGRGTQRSSRRGCPARRCGEGVPGGARSGAALRPPPPGMASADGRRSATRSAGRAEPLRRSRPQRRYIKPREAPGRGLGAPSLSRTPPNPHIAAPRNFLAAPPPLRAALPSRRRRSRCNFPARPAAHPPACAAAALGAPAAAASTQQLHHSSPPAAAGIAPPPPPPPPLPPPQRRRLNAGSAAAIPRAGSAGPPRSCLRAAAAAPSAAPARPDGAAAGCAHCTRSGAPSAGSGGTAGGAAGGGAARGGSAPPRPVPHLRRGGGKKRCRGGRAPRFAKTAGRCARGAARASAVLAKSSRSRGARREQTFPARIPPSAGGAPPERSRRPR